MASTTVLIPMIIALATIVYAYFKYKFQYWKKKNVPCMEPSIPYGSFQTSITKINGVTDNICTSYQVAVKNNWKYVGIYNLTMPSLVIADLDILKYVLTKDFSNFVDRGFYHDENQPISGHLFALDGTKWKTMRAKLSPTFSSGKMKMMFQSLADYAIIMQKRVDEISQEKQTGGVDIKNILGCFTTDVIGSVAFGLQCNTLDDPTNPFRVVSQRAVSDDKYLALKQAIFENFPKLAATFGIFPVRKDVEKFFHEIVSETVEYRRKNNVERKDFLQLLIDAKKSQSENGLKVGDVEFTLDEMVAQSFVFFVGGFETSSTTMAFALYHLARNQEIQEKLREEIHRVLKKHNGVITYDSLSEMSYMRQVLDETLRMHPAVPIITRNSANDYKVPNSDLILEKGTKVLVPIRGIHYNEEIYPNPQVFDPERFSTEQKAARHPYAHIPFGEGPRMCIGMRFGLMQSTVGVATILNKYKVTVNERTQTPLKMSDYSFVPSTEGGIWLNIEKVSH